MRKRSKRLRPDHAKVAHTSKLYLREDSVVYVSEQVTKHTHDNGFTPKVAIYRPLVNNAAL